MWNLSHLIRDSFLLDITVLHKYLLSNIFKSLIAINRSQNQFLKSFLLRSYNCMHFYSVYNKTFRFGIIS